MSQHINTSNPFMFSKKSQSNDQMDIENKKYTLQSFLNEKET